MKFIEFLDLGGGQRLYLFHFGYNYIVEQKHFFQNNTLKINSIFFQGNKRRTRSSSSTTIGNFHFETKCVAIQAYFSILGHVEMGV